MFGETRPIEKKREGKAKWKSKRKGKKRKKKDKEKHSLVNESASSASGKVGHKRTASVKISRTTRGQVAATAVGAMLMMRPKGMQSGDPRVRIGF